jgi:hypothetical protein
LFFAKVKELTAIPKIEKEVKAIYEYGGDRAKSCKY